MDVAALFHEANKPFSPDPDTQTISVEVLSVQGATATAISKDSHVFYDTEVLAIIHRFKSKTSGLVGTKVWAWRGNKGSVGEREEKKLQELARRYGTSLVSLFQRPAHSMTMTVSHRSRYINILSHQSLSMSLVAVWLHDR